MCFDFSVPVTWSDIISTLSLLAAVIAAIIAICGNKQSQKQFEKSMAAQERSTNLSLFDERIGILESIKKDTFKFSRDRASFLFDENIVSHINKYDRVSRELDDIVRIKNQFASTLRDMTCDGREEEFNFPDLLYIYDNCSPGENCSEDEYLETEKVLKEYQLTIQIDCGDFGWHEYNYVELSNKNIELYKELRNIRKTLLEEMRDFIKSSISNGESTKE